MQNYQELCLRNMCTCVAWAQFLYIIMLYCFGVILQMWDFNKNYITKSDSLPSVFIPFTIDISELFTE